MLRNILTLLVCLLFSSFLLAQEPVEPQAAPPTQQKGRGPFGNRTVSPAQPAGPARRDQASSDLSMSGKLVTLDLLIATPAEPLSAPTAAKIIELEQAAKLQSAVRLQLSALENQSAHLQFGNLVARVTGRTMAPSRAQSVPTYTDINVGTTARAISRVHENGSVITQLTIERSGLASQPTPATADDKPNFDPPPAVFTITLQTTVSLKPGQPLIISGGQPTTKESTQTWIVVTAKIGDGQ